MESGSGDDGRGWGGCIAKPHPKTAPQNFSLVALPEPSCRACRSTRVWRRCQRLLRAPAGKPGALPYGHCTPFDLVCNRCRESVAVMKSQFFFGPAKVRFAGVLGV